MATNINQQRKPKKGGNAPAAPAVPPPPKSRSVAPQSQVAATTTTGGMSALQQARANAAATAMGTHPSQQQKQGQSTASKDSNKLLTYEDIIKNTMKTQQRAPYRKPLSHGPTETPITLPQNTGGTITYSFAPPMQYVPPKTTSSPSPATQFVSNIYAQYRDHRSIDQSAISIAVPAKIDHSRYENYVKTMQTYNKIVESYIKKPFEKSFSERIQMTYDQFTRAIGSQDCSYHSFRDDEYTGSYNVDVFYRWVPPLMDSSRPTDVINVFRDENDTVVALSRYIADQLYIIVAPDRTGSNRYARYIYLDGYELETHLFYDISLTSADGSINVTLLDVDTVCLQQYLTPDEGWYKEEEPAKPALMPTTFQQQPPPSRMYQPPAAPFQAQTQATSRYGTNFMVSRPFSSYFG